MIVELEELELKKEGCQQTGPGQLRLRACITYVLVVVVLVVVVLVVVLVVVVVVGVYVVV